MLLPLTERKLFSGEIILEDFQSMNKSPFPKWKVRKENSNRYKIYSIANDRSNRYLQATTSRSTNSIQIGLPLNRYSQGQKMTWDIINHPWLTWDWRVKRLPAGGNEKIKSKNDSAAGIYVIFQSAYVPFAGWKYQPVNWIKYVWSSTLPVGTVVSRTIKDYGITIRGKYVVVASGKKGLGKWINFKRNVLYDYIQFFREKPKYPPIMIGILTDANATHDIAEADYDNIKVSSE